MVLLGMSGAGDEQQGGHTRRQGITGARGGDQHTCMLVLEEGGAECDGVVRAGVCAPAKAGGHAVDGQASLDLGGDDATGGVVGSTEARAGREAEGRGGVAGNGGDLGEREVAAGEGDGGARAAGGWVSGAREGGGGRTGSGRARVCERHRRRRGRTWRQRRGAEPAVFYVARMIRPFELQDGGRLCSVKNIDVVNSRSARSPLWELARLSSARSQIHKLTPPPSSANTFSEHSLPSANFRDSCQLHRDLICLNFKVTRIQQCAVGQPSHAILSRAIPLAVHVHHSNGASLKLDDPSTSLHA